MMLWGISGKPIDNYRQMVDWVSETRGLISDWKSLIGDNEPVTSKR